MPVSTITEASRLWMSRLRREIAPPVSFDWSLPSDAHPGGAGKEEQASTRHAATVRHCAGETSCQSASRQVVDSPWRSRCNIASALQDGNTLGKGCGTWKRHRGLIQRVLLSPTSDG